MIENKHATLACDEDKNKDDDDDDGFHYKRCLFVSN